ncbi:MAG TPA: NADPH-dependent FMN reductase [Thermoplasmata archaeon]|nr:NADPH-dependent FMN reductase [Thermoplasmata archaeon]
MALDLPILFGTVRSERHSIHVARYVYDLLGKRPGVETRLWDPVDLPFGNLVRREWEMTERPATVEVFVRAMEHADGFVIVTPEYNFGIPGALKNLIDHVYDEWNRKPFGFITAGGIVGGVRAQDQLRQVISGVRGITIPTSIPVQQVEKTWDKAGPMANRADWDARFDRFFSELEWYARALQTARAEPAPSS